MDPIGITRPVIVSAPAMSAPSAQSAPAIALPVPAPVQPEATFDIHVAEQKHVEAVRQAAQQIANVFVVGDQSFSLFKDMTGQYITRFTSLRDGKVTYIPEPTLFKISGSGNGAAPMLKIQA